MTQNDAATETESAPGTSTAAGADWLDVGSVDEVSKARRVVVPGHDDEQILVLMHDGSFHALDNICIHRDRELIKGVILKDRLVCPGHQWAFDLSCGWEAVKNQCQPTYTVRVVDERVEVDLNSRATVTSAPTD